MNDYDNGLFLDSLVDHAAAIYIPIIQQGEGVDALVNLTISQLCSEDPGIAYTQIDVINIDIPSVLLGSRSPFVSSQMADMTIIEPIPQ